MSDMQVSQILQQMRTMAAMSKGESALEASTQVAKPDFGQMLKNSINAVNETQKTAGGLETSFEAGDPSTSLSEVMVAIQKANVSFQAMTQVRNNLVSAYKEIMNMQV